MAAIITLERPDTDDARALISELEAELQPLYPRESRPGYSVQQLLDEGISTRRAIMNSHREPAYEIEVYGKENNKSDIQVDIIGTYYNSAGYIF